MTVSEYFGDAWNISDEVAQVWMERGISEANIAALRRIRSYEQGRYATRDKAA